MYLELPCDGAQGVGNRLLRATLPVKRYIHIMPLDFKVWRVACGGWRSSCSSG